LPGGQPGKDKHKPQRQRSNQSQDRGDRDS
jgi:hypothetical protein